MTSRQNRFLIDTNVISEFTRKDPNPKVLQWFQSNGNNLLFLSVATVGEIEQGIHHLPDSNRKQNLVNWVNNKLLVQYSGFILPADVETFRIWGELTAIRMTQGNKISVMDGLIAATAQQHKLTLVTRNISDFENLGLLLINPWD